MVRKSCETQVLCRNCKVRILAVGTIREHEVYDD